jgi:hypothetical protein
MATSPLSAAITRHHAALAKAGGVDAVIVCEGKDLALRIIRLRQDTEATDAAGEAFTEHQPDFGIAADELVFPDLGKREPAEGMEIRTEGKRYRVTPTGGARCFDVMDSLGLLYRVHTVCKGDFVSE